MIVITNDFIYAAISQIWEDVEAKWFQLSLQAIVDDDDDDVQFTDGL